MYRERAISDMVLGRDTKRPLDLNHWQVEKKPCKAICAGVAGSIMPIYRCTIALPLPPTGMKSLRPSGRVAGVAGRNPGLDPGLRRPLPPSAVGWVVTQP